MISHGKTRNTRKKNRTKQKINPSFPCLKCICYSYLCFPIPCGQCYAVAKNVFVTMILILKISHGINGISTEEIGPEKLNFRVFSVCPWLIFFFMENRSNLSAKEKAGPWLQDRHPTVPQMPYLGQTSANWPVSMPVPNEIGLLSTRVDSYRQPIDTQTTPFRHPKIPVLVPSCQPPKTENGPLLSTWVDSYRHESTWVNRSKTEILKGSG